MRWSLLLLLIAIPHLAFAEPKVAVAPLDDDDGKIADVVADAVGEHAKLTKPARVENAMKSMGVSVLSPKSLKKLRAKLDVDVVVYGSVERDGGTKRVSLTFAGSSKAKLELEAKNTKQLRKELAAKVAKRIDAAMAGGGDDEEDEEDARAKREQKKEEERKAREEEERRRKQEEEERAAEAKREAEAKRKKEEDDRKREEEERRAERKRRDDDERSARDDRRKKRGDDDESGDDRRGKKRGDDDERGDRRKKRGDDDESGDDRRGKKRRDDDERGERDDRRKKRGDDDESGDDRRGKKRVADEDEDSGRARKRLGDEDDESGDDEDRPRRKKRRERRHVLTQAALWLDGGAAVARRTLTYQATGTMQPPRVGTAAPAGRLEGEVYPAAFSTLKGAAAGFGVNGELAYTFGLGIAVPGTQITAPIKNGHYAVGARYRFVFGEHAVALGVAYWRRYYMADRTKLMNPDQLDMPDVDYTAIAPNVAARIAATPKISVFGSLDFPLMLNSGPIQKPTSYGAAKILAFDLRAGTQIVIADHVALQVAAEFDQIGMSFTGQTGSMSVTRKVTAATDRSIGIAAAVGVNY